jgi:hypothetical protein
VTKSALDYEKQEQRQTKSVKRKRTSIWRRLSRRRRLVKFASSLAALMPEPRSVQKTPLHNMREGEQRNERKQGGRNRRSRRSGRQKRKGDRGKKT